MVWHLLGDVPEHVPTYVLEHVPGSHMLGTVLESSLNLNVE